MGIRPFITTRQTFTLCTPRSSFSIAALAAGLLLREYRAEHSFLSVDEAQVPGPIDERGRRVFGIGAFAERVNRCRTVSLPVAMRVAKYSAIQSMASPY